MDYQKLSTQISKPTYKWRANDIQIWLNFISMPELKDNFNCHGVDGSCLHSLDPNDLETQLGVKSKIGRKKIMKWIQTGFNQFNSYLSYIQSYNNNQYQKQQMIDYPDLPQMQKSTTSLLRQKIKPQNLYEKENISSSYSEMIVTTYQGPHANFYTISASSNLIGRSPKSSIIVLEESAAKNHAQIIKINEKFFIKDLATNTGTFIKVFQKQQMKVGMIIEMGSFQFSVKNINVKQGIIIINCFNTIKNQFNSIDINFNNKKCFSFGRKNTNDFYYDDQHLSGIHAKINFVNGIFVLQDMSSTNGTWIRIGPNNQVSQPFQLYHGCVFKIGTTSTYICKMNNENNDSKLNKIPLQKCCSCNINQTDAVLIPCKHNIMCFECSKNFTHCPVCNNLINQKFKIFI